MPNTLAADVITTLALFVLWKPFECLQWKSGAFGDSSFLTGSNGKNRWSNAITMDTAHSNASDCGMSLLCLISTVAVSVKGGVSRVYVSCSWGPFLLAWLRLPSGTVHVVLRVSCYSFGTCVAVASACTCVCVCVDVCVLCWWTEWRKWDGLDKAATS